MDTHHRRTTRYVEGVMRSPRHLHERFLHFIWRKRYLALQELKSLDDQPIEIIDIGTSNRDSGPDFRNAKIRIGRTTYQGDVEIHHDLVDWQKHLHSDNPRYNRVILHVVLRWSPRRALLQPPRTQSGREVPTLVLEPFLNEPLRFIWQRAILDERRERISTIRCHGLNKDVPPKVIKEWIERLAIERIELKIRKFDGRLRELVDEHRLVVKEPYPRYYEDSSEIPPPVKDYRQKDFSKKILWEQLLYEGIMEGLGYSKNQEAFLRLARNLSLEFIHQATEDDGAISLLTLQAMLFGAAGFLTSKKLVDDVESRQYLRNLKKVWREIRRNYRKEILHEADWQFFRLRPQNFPTVRLAAMSYLLHKFLRREWMREIIQTLKNQGSTTKEKLQTLQSLLSVEGEGRQTPADPLRYWTEHFRFGSLTHKPTKRLLGRDRINEIILNTIIPVTLLYARIFKDSLVRAEGLTLYKNFPPAASNTILRTMRSQLLKTRVPITTASLQQGTIQLYKFYCVEERCKECEIGKIVFANEPSPASL